MRRRDAELIRGVRADLALARGIALARTKVAEEAVAEAEATLEHYREQESEAADIAQALQAVSAHAAPGASGARWHEWPLLDNYRSAARLGGYRIGDIRIGEIDVPVLLPLLDAAHLSIHTIPSRRAEADGIISGVLLRALTTAPAGALRLSVYDPDRLGGTLAGFAPLTDARLLVSTGPDELGKMLSDLIEHIRRINERVLAGQYPSVAALAETIGRRPEPWRVGVLFGGSEQLNREQHANIERILRTGASCGVHLILCDFPVPEIGPTETIVLDDDGVHTSLVNKRWPLYLDEAPPQSLITSTSQALANEALVGPDPAKFDSLLPERLWNQSSASGLSAPVGDHDGALVNVALGDSPPHALIGGPSGSGKTNFLYALLGSLAARYNPHELEFYLLDFKEGVSFARFARGRKDPSWLPHARLIGVNINSDREFGLALLRFLSEQLRIRAEAAKAHEVTKLEELRAESPGDRWPRIVAVIDEFQYLFVARDKVTEEAVKLLEDLARRGRSQGIHLILSSQDLSSIEALWGKSSITAQFTLRVALPKARRILADDNPLADSIPRWHAVVNSDSGASSANRVARIPDAGARGALDALQAQLWQRRPRDLPEPVLFDGDVVPQLEHSVDFHNLEAGGQRAPSALIGQLVDVRGTAATVRLSRAPGRNLVVIGNRVQEACDVLVASALSLSRQFQPGEAKFSLVCLDDGATEQAEGLRQRLARDGHDVTWHGIDDVRALLQDTANRIDSAIVDEVGRPNQAHYLLFFAVDSANAILTAAQAGSTTSGLDNLRQVLKRGPEVRVHVLGWWHTVQRLRDDLGGLSIRFDDIGAWLALDVQGADLTPLPGGQYVPWHPRARRALFFDRAVHAHPQVVIPFDTATSLLSEGASS